ncbi:MAG TPA: dihydroorotase [Bacteroidota bacterium]|nr:dihydroorotase [Bacteroidota bacterium]
MNLLLKNGHIIDPATEIDAIADILVVDGKIEKIGQGLSSPKQSETIDLNSKVVAPGFIDIHVHLREPGFEHKETIDSGCRAAAAGGFTAVCCMPNTNPAIDDASVVRTIIEKGKNVLHGIVDIYPVGAATMARAGKELSPMFELAEAGAVAFSDDGAPIESAEMMRRVLEYAGTIGKPVIQHAEDVSMTRGGAMNEGIVSTSLGLPPMPPIAEDVLIARDITLVEYLGSAYHVAHMSTAGATELVRQAKRRKLPVTCEVTPHHFALTDEAVRSYDTNTKMNPPLRTQRDLEAVIEGLRDGTIDVIATDHAPHSFDEKQVEFTAAPFGIIGLETAIGLSLTKLVHTKILTLQQLIEKFSSNPRRILGLPKISIAEGESANLTIFDTAVEWKVDLDKFKSRSKNSPFSNWPLKGKSFGIVNNGFAYINDKILS